MNFLVRPTQRFAVSPLALSLLIALSSILAASGTFGQPAQSTAAASTALVPRAQFSEMEVDFGTVNSTAKLRHDFVITNLGSAVLEITKVQPGCGCTTANDWDRTIEPGKTGKIPIQFDASRFRGTVRKAVMVSCNDQEKPFHTLHIQATVLRPFDVTPAFVSFLPVENEAVGAPKLVRIVNNMEPVTLALPVSTTPLFKPELKTIRPGKEFELHVSYTAVTNVQGTITIETSSTNMPKLSINASVRPQPAISTTPQMVRLPASFSPDYWSAVSVRNNSSAPLSLSDPVVNVKGITAEIREIEAGRMFTISLTPAPEFKLQPGEQAELTVKTSHPKYPLFKVPITQLPARAALVPIESR